MTKIWQKYENMTIWSRLWRRIHYRGQSTTASEEICGSAVGEYSMYEHDVTSVASVQPERPLKTNTGWQNMRSAPTAEIKWWNSGAATTHRWSVVGGTWYFPHTIMLEVWWSTTASIGSPNCSKLSQGKRKLSITCLHWSRSTRLRQCGHIPCWRKCHPIEWTPPPKLRE